MTDKNVPSRNFKLGQFDDAPPDLSLANNPVEPGHAATMILVRKNGPEPRILMGQRASGHDFMPDKYVFPGGRMDAVDASIAVQGALGADCEALLKINSDISPQALVLAAIRETFEETGLIIGRSVDETDFQTFKQSPTSGSWNNYFAHGVQPCLKKIQFIGRAITPPYRPKRFDARFFLAESEQVLAELKRPVDSHELLDLRWFTFDEIKQLDLPSITRFTIQEVQKRIEQPNDIHAPFLTYWKDNESYLERLSL